MFGSTQRAASNTAPRHAQSVRQIADKLGDPRRRAVPDRSPSLGLDECGQDKRGYEQKQRRNRNDNDGVPPNVSTTP